MKRLLFLFFLLPLFSLAQSPVNGTIQKTVATDIIRYYNSGAAGIDTIPPVRMTGATNGWTLVYNSTTKKFHIAPVSSLLSVGAFGSTPNANGLSLSSGVLTMQPASASFPGGVSTGTQAFVGSKTFISTLIANAFQSSIGTSGGGNNHFILLTGGNARAAIGLVGVDGVNTGSNSVWNNYLDNGTAVPVFSTVRATGAIAFSGTVTSPITRLTSVSGVAGGTDSLLSKNATTNVVTKIPADYYAPSTGTASGLTAGNATTLANTRTIFGQNFNGSANVTGNMSSVGTITQSANASIMRTMTSTATFGGYDLYQRSAVDLGYIGNNDAVFGSGGDGLGVKSLGALKIGGTSTAIVGLGTGTVTATADVLSVTSNSWMKDLHGRYKGSALSAISKIKSPEYWNYNSKSGLPKITYTVNQFGLFADDVHEALGEEFAPTQGMYDKAGNFIPTLIDGQKSYGLSDRALLSLTIQALQEANKRIENLEKKLKKVKP